MGLTNQSMGRKLLRDSSNISDIDRQHSALIALIGNPNTGKSTVFNGLTGMKQHTGNWPGKTVATAVGNFVVEDLNFSIVDLPGTYSLLANSVEEEIARDFIYVDQPDITIIVADATCLERNLNLVLQILEMSDSAILCINLIDEAQQKSISIDIPELSRILGIPVVTTNARDKVGLDKLKREIYRVTTGEVGMQPHRIEYDNTIEDILSHIELLIPSDNATYKRWVALRALEGDLGLKLNSSITYNIQGVLTDLDIDQNEARDSIATALIQEAEKIAGQTVSFKTRSTRALDKKIDDIVTSKLYGIPIMLFMLGLIFWITIVGANYPSDLLYNGFFSLEKHIIVLLDNMRIPQMLQDMLIFGVYRTLVWVIAVMLPPMAIFFPLFTFLEDLGYLPRVAFNLDNLFKRAGAHGKQSLTMSMGFGCNAAGIISCRIIDTPRERLIAILTNNFVPCNGRFPILIAVSYIFIGNLFRSQFSSLIAALTILGAVLIGVIATLVVSKFLSATLLKGVPSSFSLELPPYRRPKLGQILVRSIFDRTLFVLARAIAVAAPAGFIIWAMANIQAGGANLLDITANTLDPFARAIGMDGYILTAFILGLPANEIVIPILIMGYTRAGMLVDMENLHALRALFLANGWNYVTAICVMIFTLLHFPCATTLLTIKKETASNKWTLLSFIIPTLVGIVLCFIIAQTARLLGMA